MDLKVPMVEFVIDQRISGFDLATVEGRVGALRAAAPVVAELRDPLLQPEYVRVLARRLGLDTEDVRREVGRAARGSTSREPDSARAEDESGMARVTIASLPRTADVALERDALMGFLQFGHRIDRTLLERAVHLPFRNPALDAVRQSVGAAEDFERPGWAADAVGTVREPYRQLGAELLTADFPALTDDAAVASTTDLARRLVGRSLDREKSELLGAIQRVPAESTEGRGIRLRLRELDVERRSLAIES
jgi:DNA primase